MTADQHSPTAAFDSAALNSAQESVATASAAQAPTVPAPALSAPALPEGSLPLRDPAFLADLASDVRSTSGGDEVHSIEPFTGERLAVYTASSEEDVRQAAATARSAQRAWEAAGIGARTQWLGRFHAELMAHRDEIITLIQAETGKSRIHAFDEFMHVLLVASYYQRTAAKVLRPESRRAAIPGLTRTTLYRHPHGVVGHISPWNYPLSLSVSDAITPLVAGNAILHKPDTQTALVSLYCRRLALKAGLDPQLWQVVVGEGKTVGPAVVENADFISFTGSTATGKDVATRAAQRMIGTSLELGGKNGMLVTAGADVHAAAEAAVRGCFSSAGQLCVSIERIYVERPAYQAFKEAFIAATERYVLGVGYGADYDMGTLTGARQLATVSDHVNDAVAHGAVVLSGGRPRPDLAPFAFEPTILEGVTAEAKCFGQETFGPVVSLYAVDSVEEGIEQMNSTPYGLNASVWAGSGREGRRLAERVVSGSVNVNEMFAATFGSVDSPMQGYGLSGKGGRHGREGLEHMTWTKTVSVQGPIGFGVPTGVSRETFMNVMTKGLGVMKALRM